MIRNASILAVLFLSVIACKKKNCQTCTKTIGGVAGNSAVESREVCDTDEADALEKSSAGTTVWKCE